MNKEYKENDWISIDDKLPKKHKTVNVKYKNGEYGTCWVQGTGNWAYNLDDIITHWKEVQDEQ